MAKIIDMDAASAFNESRTFSRSNTVVAVEEQSGKRITMMYLHGNKIARKVVDLQTNEKEVFFTDAGWPTVTTKARLNAIGYAWVSTKRFQLHLNDESWDGSWTKVY